ncbi:MAG TPA: glutamine synthetase family protein [Bacteroidales bacterium]|jgi:glutamine synthetase|nr:glutamine synthetase family protein [Bacteroidales bacterium]
MNNDVKLNQNELVQFLKKPAALFTHEDIVRFVEAKGISMINFRYVSEDGKLKTLNFVPFGSDHLDSILTGGERVDGSSLFPFMSSGSSDLYVVPRYRTAFVNPFSEIPALDILCSFYDNEGKPLESSPEYILRKAYTRFMKSTGFNFKAFGELEYYIKSPRNDLYPLTDQKGYHQSAPFAKYEGLRIKAMELCARAGCRIKYGHAEVGSFTDGADDYEQHEIEFLPVEIDEAVDQLLIAKWIIRNLCFDNRVEVSFAPKITVGKAGSGLHIHMMLERDGKNMMVEKGKLSNNAKKMIAGILEFSASLTAFGNTIPTSYFRLVPHQEAPVNICWGDRNRSVLIRVPLGWNGCMDMVKDANPGDDTDFPLRPSKQTVELRSPDGSADIYKLFAGIVVAAEYGLSMENGLEKANELYVDYNVFDGGKAKNKKLDALPSSCSESAECLQTSRKLYEKDGVFPSGVIDNVIAKLRSYNDEGLSEKLYNKPDEISKLVKKYLHCS